jgi:hypothetical protein
MGLGKFGVALVASGLAEFQKRRQTELETCHVS